MKFSFCQTLLEYENETGCGVGCEICNGELDICELCGPGLYYNIQVQKCEPTSINQCVYYTAVDVCKECLEGNKLLNNRCQSCDINNCKTCNSSLSVCDECKDGFTSTTTSSSDCNLACADDNCLRCARGSQNVCEECKEGFGKDSSNNCVACQVEGCKKCDSDRTKCDFIPDERSCQSNYYYFNTTCVQCQNGCLECDIQGICQRCDTDRGFWMFRDMKCKISKISNPFWIILLFLVILLNSIF